MWGARVVAQPVDLDGPEKVVYCKLAETTVQNLILCYTGDGTHDKVARTTWPQPREESAAAALMPQKPSL